MGTPTRSTFVIPNATVTDTPAKMKSTLTARAFTNGLEEGRKAVMLDLGHAIPAVSVKYFQTALLPPIRRDLNVNNIITRLRHAGYLNKKKRWIEFFKKEPSKALPLENNVFEDFERIADVVLEAAGTAITSWAAAHPNEVQQDARPTTKFQCNPNDTPESKSRDNTSKPDSFAVLNPCAPFSQPITLSTPNHPGVLWDDIVAPGEFKKKTTVADINDVSN